MYALFAQDTKLLKSQNLSMHKIAIRSSRAQRRLVPLTQQVSDLLGLVNSAQHVRFYTLHVSNQRIKFIVIEWVFSGGATNTPLTDRLVKAKSEQNLPVTSPAPVDTSLNRLKSRSLEPLTGLAMWCAEPIVIELPKGDRGLGFSILDYQVRVTAAIGHTQSCRHIF